MKKQILFLFMALMLALCLCATGAMAKKDKCIKWGYLWNGMTDYNYTYTRLYDNGTFVTDEGGAGIWEKVGGGTMLQYTNGCRPLYAGNKNRGFFECTDNSTPSGPNYFTIKGTKRKYCENIALDNGTGEADGLSLVEQGTTGYSPE